MNHLTGKWLSGERLHGHSVRDRIMAKVIEDHKGCWLFVGARRSDDYGTTSVDGRLVLAHRALFELEIGPIPEGMTLDHLCRVTACVNPAHMEIVSMRENILRGGGVCAANLRKTHCVRGHDLALARVETDSRGRTKRRCLECERTS